MTIEEHSLIGGLGSAVAELLSDRYQDQMPRVLRIGIPDCFPMEYGSQESMMQSFGLQPLEIAKVIHYSVLKADQKNNSD